MKKILSVLLFVTLIFIACSDDNNEVSNPLQKRISKIYQTKTITGTEVNALGIFNYDSDGNLSEYKEVNIDENGKETGESFSYTFIYGNKQLLKVKRMSRNSTLISTTEFKHKEDTLFSIRKYPDNDYFSYRDTLLINENGSLDKCLYEYFGISTYEYDTNSNLIRKNTLFLDNIDEISQYTYDNKASFNSNQGNFPKWLWCYWMFYPYEQTGLNNRLSEKTSSSSNEIYSTNTVYEYDEDGFPIQANGNYPNGNTYSMKFVYESF